MSIFSSLRKSRQQAKEHNAKLAVQKKKEEELAPYKHVPTHAATDAFASAPPSWREADRTRIVEQNRRRSAMAASGHHMNMVGAPRVGSSLAFVSYPAEDKSPMIRVPRAHSYSGVSPYTAGARDSREMMYAPSDMSYMRVSLKGKEVPRAYDSQGVSPASSKGGPSPTDSSDGSTSSQDDLEMKPSKSKSRASTAERVATHRLHPSHARRQSDASVNQYLSSAAKPPQASHSRDSRPPPSMRGFGSIPAIAAMPPTFVGGLQGSSALPAHVGPSSTNASSASSTPTPTSRQGSATSLPGLSNGAMMQAASAPVTPLASTGHKKEYGMNWVSLPGPELDMHTPNVGAAAGRSLESGGDGAFTGPYQRGRSERHSTLVSSYQEPDHMQQKSSEAHAPVPHQRMDQSRAPPPLAHEHLVNVFPEEAGPDCSSKKSKKDKKASKGSGGKLFKKNRWSSSKAPAVAV
ncbi:hypothetical protein QQS21_008019 [Conoideocrella luteorostrata]|uniref:Uncharacterized protein n=1 Tax=Conoideocrella luteorostrata TaxID=1105319 RepID=A0AAJ0FYZ8_9HYPO|nr:hypothetical protein QQS21_008019 [Conoideocrella luteorostrata]